MKSVPSSFFKDLSHEAKAKDSTLKAKAKTKDFKIVLEGPRGRGLVLEDSNTVYTYLATSTVEDGAAESEFSQNSLLHLSRQRRQFR